MDALLGEEKQKCSDMTTSSFHATPLNHLCFLESEISISCAHPRPQSNCVQWISVADVHVPVFLLPCFSITVEVKSDLVSN